MSDGDNNTEEQESNEENEEQRRYFRSFIGRGYILGFVRPWVRDYVPEKVKEEVNRVGKVFSDRMVAGSKVIADKVNDIAMEASGECTIKEDDDREPYIANNHIRVMNKIRKKRPDLFRKMAVYAEEYVGIPDNKKTEEVVEYFKGLDKDLSFRTRSDEDDG